MVAANGTIMHGWPDSLHWWIDSVGGYLVLTKDVIRIGQAGSRGVDLPLLADISANHAEIRRGDAGIILVPNAETTVNGKSASGFVLHHGDRVKMRSVEMVFHQPIRWSSTVRLEFPGRRRLPLSLDGVLLLGETCVLGDRRDAHVRTPWTKPVVINRYRDRYWIRTSDELRIDGQRYDGYGPLAPSSHVHGSWGSFRWEPAEPN
jgi:hypothetical protein